MRTKLIISAILITTFSLILLFFNSFFTSNIPRAEVPCAAQATWQTITPGISTIMDVTSLLGKPVEKALIHPTPSEWFVRYRYMIPGYSKAYYFNEVYFDLLGKVRYIIHFIGNTEKQFIPIERYIDLYGNTPDLVFQNNDIYPIPNHRIDVHAFIDYIVVWSSCGVMVDVIPTSECKCMYERIGSPKEIIGKYQFPHLSSFGNFENSAVSSDAIVLLEFLFIPTTEKGYIEYFLAEKPFLMNGIYQFVN